MKLSVCKFCGKKPHLCHVGKNDWKYMHLCKLSIKDNPKIINVESGDWYETKRMACISWNHRARGEDYILPHRNWSLI